MKGVIWSYKEGLEHFKAAVICKLFEAKASVKKKKKKPMCRAQTARRTQMTCGMSRRRWKKPFPTDWEAYGCPSTDEMAGLCLMLKCKSGTKRATSCDGCPGHAHVLTRISSVTVQKWGSVTFPARGSHSATIDLRSPLQIYCLRHVVPAVMNMYNLLILLGRSYETDRETSVSL